MVDVDALRLRHPHAPCPVIDAMALSIGSGERVALVGPNGSGKSTLLRALARQHRPEAGSIRLDGRDVWAMSIRDHAKVVGFLPQFPSVAEGLPIELVVAMGRTPHLARLGTLTAHDRRVIDDAMARTGVDRFRGRSLETLSGGEQRRTWLAMVLVQEPRLLLLDEPTAGLDVRHQWELVSLLEGLHQDRATTMVTAVHELDLAATFPRVVVVRDGKIVADGPPENALHPTRVAQVFGVRAEMTVHDGRVRLTVTGPLDGAPPSPSRSFQETTT